jgi:hypothetical protein
MAASAGVDRVAGKIMELVNMRARLPVLQLRRDGVQTGDRHAQPSQE